MFWYKYVPNISLDILKIEIEIITFYTKNYLLLIRNSNLMILHLIWQPYLEAQWCHRG